MKIIIYKLTCLVTNKSYIGQTKNSVKRRIYYHIEAESLIGEAIREYELKNFKLELLWEAVNKKEADITEKAAICAYRTKVPNGYNIAKGGGFSGGPIGNKNAQGNTNMRGRKNPAVIKSNKRRKGEKRPKVSEFMRNNNPMKRPEVAAKFKGKKNVAYRLDVKIKKLRNRIKKLENGKLE